MNEEMKKVLFQIGSEKFPEISPKTYEEFLENEKEADENDPEISKVLYGAMEKYAELVAKKFFYWWYNSPGSNTEQGFAEFIKKVDNGEIHLST